jgi:hypothetical protein
VKSASLAPWPPTPMTPGLPGEGVLDGADGARPGRRARLGGRQDLDQPGASRRRPGGGGEGGVDPGDLAGLAGHGAGPSGGGQHVDRAEYPRGDPAAFQAGPPCPGAAGVDLPAQPRVVDFGADGGEAAPAAR